MSLYDKYYDYFEDDSDVNYVVYEPDNDAPPYDGKGLSKEKLDAFAPDKRKTELLAPVTPSSYKHVIYCGADAVYFGYGDFNARANGENFDNLSEVVSFCHLHGVRAYLALNVSIKNSELDKVKEIIIEAENLGIDAFIITDLALLPIIKKHSKAQVHASTQVGVHNYLGAKLLWDMGFDRVILSREATFNEIAEIKKKLRLSIEVFVHGALCVGFSGACLFSSMLTGNSGNRGRCNQLCRRQFTCVINGKKVKSGYLLSAKDINSASVLPSFREFQIDAMKIEGRMRKTEYACGVTDVYSRLLKNNSSASADDSLTLQKLYNRGGFFNGYPNSKGEDVIFPDVCGHLGVKCGKITRLISSGSALVNANFAINQGDGFKILRGTAEIGGATGTGAVKDGKYLINFTPDTREAVKEGDLVYLTTDAELNRTLMNKRKRIQATLDVSITEGTPSCVVARSRDSVSVTYGDTVQVAKGKPVTEADVRTQFSKFIDTEFFFNIDKIVLGNVFLAKSQLNDLRRKTVEKLQKTLLEDYRRKSTRKPCPIVSALTKVEGDFIEFSDAVKLDDIVKLCEKFQLKNIVYAPYDFNLADCKKFYAKLKKEDNLIYIKPPIFMPQDETAFLRELVGIFDGVLANNLYAVQAAFEAKKLAVGGVSLNVMNTKNPLIKMLNRFVASVELTKEQLTPFRDALVYAYGDLPLMYLNHCPKKVAGLNCGACKCDLKYEDEKGVYPIKTIKFGKYCRHILKNAATTNVGNTLKDKGRYFDFSDADALKIDEVLEGYYGNATYYCPPDFNRLHLSRGVK